MEPLRHCLFPAQPQVCTLQGYLAHKKHPPSRGPAAGLFCQRDALIFVYESMPGDIRLWVGPRLGHFLSSWDLTRAQTVHPD